MVRQSVPGVFAVVVAAVKLYIGVYKTVIQGAFNLVRAGIEKAMALMRAVPGRTKSALGDLGSLLYDAGKQIVSGLINGIKDKAWAAKDAVGGVVTEAIDRGKDLLGINFPSRVFHEFGVRVGEGFSSGLDASRTPVSRCGPDGLECDARRSQGGDPAAQPR